MHLFIEEKNYWKSARFAYVCLVLSQAFYALLTFRNESTSTCPSVIPFKLYQLAHLSTLTVLSFTKGNTRACGLCSGVAADCTIKYWQDKAPPLLVSPDGKQVNEAWPITIGLERRGQACLVDYTLCPHDDGRCYLPLANGTCYSKAVETCNVYLGLVHVL